MNVKVGHVHIRPAGVMEYACICRWSLHSRLSLSISMNSEHKGLCRRCVLAEGCYCMTEARHFEQEVSEAHSLAGEGMLPPGSQFEGLRVGSDGGWQFGLRGPGWPSWSTVMPKGSRHGSHSLVYLLQQLVCRPQDLALAHARACGLQAAGSISRRQSAPRQAFGTQLGRLCRQRQAEHAVLAHIPSTGHMTEATQLHVTS